MVRMEFGLTSLAGPCTLRDNQVSPLTGPFYEEKA